MNKKASFQLSVNFIVVMIICIMLLGIGIGLMKKFIDVGGGLEKEVSEEHKRSLMNALEGGALVSVYPARYPLNRGDDAKFSVGINNELGRTSDFSIYILPHPNNPSGAEPPKVLYIQDSMTLKNNQQDYQIIKIKIPKSASPGTHIFTLYACNATICGADPNIYNHYGSLQKLYVNVR
ncbi:MAG: hypothetical protein KKF46_03125 [Nanoarchaeota archaeon]|nr:hypothetical protein [Nanoarchaeota archaeon]MBU1321326.1 hypothetical protein [Nanoarchaeota archaeon]MBU1597533.1 hypothetical protein [Nanoarchaeota archaeon]MBU2441126.1 hypothetical protein [Nanoarchaeota archaeon]